jgi:3-oxoacyl-[acyl-carrier-protein] synthase II
VEDRKVYITGVGNVSPQNTAGNPDFPEEIISFESTFLKCREPNYKEYISGDFVRRMSRHIKMGVAAARISLTDAGCQMPDAIITGTGLGCIEDTEKFLTNMISNNEELLTPTSFIQSTHNTVSAQIALLLKCHNYNFTYVHRGLSFESAILDSMMNIETGQAKTVLLGSSDELTTNTHLLLQRLGQVKAKPINTLDLIKDKGRGSIAGEGASFFLLSSSPGLKEYGRIKGITTFFKPSGPVKTVECISDFLEHHNLQKIPPDLVILGNNGDPGYDRIYNEVSGKIFSTSPIGYFKHLCGEYFTATSFALWLAAMIMKSQVVPAVILKDGPPPGKINTILIYNHYRNIDHSLILISRS